ncbi:hypothetical protein A6R68_09908, partial [Neotoma lepida]
MTKVTEIIWNIDQEKLEKDKYFYPFRNTDDTSQEEHQKTWKTSRNSKRCNLRIKILESLKILLTSVVVLLLQLPGWRSDDFLSKHMSLIKEKEKSSFSIISEQKSGVRLYFIEHMQKSQYYQRMKRQKKEYSKAKFDNLCRLMKKILHKMTEKTHSNEIYCMIRLSLGISRCGVWEPSVAFSNEITPLEVVEKA